MHVKRQVDNGVLSRVSFDPNREASLAEVKKIRESGIVQKKDAFWWQLSFPPMDLAKLKRKYPELDSDDMQIKAKAWNKFLKSSESQPYRVMG